MTKTREELEAKLEELKKKQEAALAENAPRDRLIAISNALLHVQELTDKHARAVEQNDRTRAKLIANAIKEAQNKLDKTAGR